jgi:YVTN family beta-propeller protein
VWVADSRGASVTRIDARTNRATHTIRVGGSPEAVVVDAGRVWVTVQAASRPPGRPVMGGTLRIVQPNDFGSTDPAVMGSFGNAARQLEYATCAKLLDYPDRPAPLGARMVPEVAAAPPRVSDGGRTYTFTVRPGYRFSPPSNRPVTAHAFQRAIERVLKGPASSDIADIVGTRAYRAGRTTHVAGISATARTLTIRLVRPSPSLPARIAMPDFCAVPPETPVRPGGLKQPIPSAGPYYIVAHTPGSELVLRRNPNYRGPRPRRLDEIDYHFGATVQQGSALVEAGRADYAGDSLGQLQSGSAVSPGVDARLARRYGPQSQAARSGRQRYFHRPRARARVPPAQRATAAVRQHTDAPGRELRRRPAGARPQRAGGLRQRAHRPISPVGHARLPRRRRLPARGPRRRPGPEPGRRPSTPRRHVHVQHPSLRERGRDRQGQPSADRHHGGYPALPVSADL